MKPVVVGSDGGTYESDPPAGGLNVEFWLHGGGFSSPSNHLSATTHGLLHETALPGAACAVAVARTPWLVKPTSWPKKVGNVLGSCVPKRSITPRMISTVIHSPAPALAGHGNGGNNTEHIDAGGG